MLPASLYLEEHINSYNMISGRICLSGTVDWIAKKQSWICFTIYAWQIIDLMMCPKHQQDIKKTVKKKKRSNLKKMNTIINIIENRKKCCLFNCLDTTNRSDPRNQYWDAVLTYATDSILLSFILAIWKNRSCFAGNSICPTNFIENLNYSILNSLSFAVCLLWSFKFQFQSNQTKLISIA